MENLKLDSPDIQQQTSPENSHLRKISSNLKSFSSKGTIMTHGICFLIGIAIQEVRPQPQKGWAYKTQIAYPIPERKWMKGKAKWKTRLSLVKIDTNREIQCYFKNLGGNLAQTYPEKIMAVKTKHAESFFRQISRKNVSLTTQTAIKMKGLKPCTTKPRIIYGL